jgi:hypothetical protein
VTLKLNGSHRGIYGSAAGGAAGYGVDYEFRAFWIPTDWRKISISLKTQPSRVKACNGLWLLKNSHFVKNSRNLRDRKCLPKRTTSFVGLPIAKFFRSFFDEWVFQQPRLFSTTNALDCCATENKAMRIDPSKGRDWICVGIRGLTARFLACNVCGCSLVVYQLASDIAVAEDSAVGQLGMRSGSGLRLSGPQHCPL